MSQSRETEALPIQVSTAIEALSRLAISAARAYEYWPTVRAIRIAGDGDLGEGYALHASSWEVIHGALDLCWYPGQQRRRLFGYYGLPSVESDDDEWVQIGRWIRDVAEPIVQALEVTGRLTKQVPTSDQLPPKFHWYWSGRFMEWVFSQAASSPWGSLFGVNTIVATERQRIPQGAQACELSVKLFKAIEMASRMELDAINGTIKAVRLSTRDDQSPRQIEATKPRASAKRTTRKSSSDQRNRAMFDEFIEGLPELEIIERHASTDYTGSDNAKIKAFRKTMQRFAERHNREDELNRREESVRRRESQQGGH